MNNFNRACGIVLLWTAAAITLPAQTLTTIHSFNYLTDGDSPFAALIQANDGNFYGTNYAGGTGRYGTVFTITPSGTLTTLHSFSFPDGSQPYAGLIQATDGNLLIGA